MKGEVRSGSDGVYFRVLGAQGQILADCLAERQALVFLKVWNARPIGRECPATMVGLEMRPIAAQRAVG